MSTPVIADILNDLEKFREVAADAIAACVQKRNAGVLATTLQIDTVDGVLQLRAGHNLTDAAVEHTAALMLAQAAFSDHLRPALGAVEQVHMTFHVFQDDNRMVSAKVVSDRFDFHKGFHLENVDAAVLTDLEGKLAMIESLAGSDEPERDYFVGFAQQDETIAMNRRVVASTAERALFVSLSNRYSGEALRDASIGDVTPSMEALLRRAVVSVPERVGLFEKVPSGAVEP